VLPVPLKFEIWKGTWWNTPVPQGRTGWIWGKMHRVLPIPFSVWHPVSMSGLFMICRRDPFCFISHRYYKPCRFFKKEVTPYGWILFGFFSFSLWGFSPLINSFAFNFACSIRSLHLSIAKSFNFTIFLSISHAICQRSKKLSMSVIHQGIDILSDSQMTDRIVIRRPPFRMCDRIPATADLFILFPGIITLNDSRTRPCSPWHEQRGSSGLSCIRNLVLRFCEKCILIR